MMDRDTPKQEKPVKAEKISRSPSLASHYASPIDPSLSLHRQVFSDSPSYNSVKSPNDTPRTPDIKEEVIVAEFPVKMEPGKTPKLPRTSSKKVISRPPPMFNDEPDAYEEATSVFQVIEDCIYANKHMGSTEPALECDCQEEWDSSTRTNDACGEDSDCINRATKMECVDDCSCGAVCQNMRFQKKEFAKVTVFKTEKKGYGLRADTDLKPNQFIFEYIGEVINEPNFRRRTRQYDEEGIKHFYFMSLNKGEFIDATKKGNLGRFCNHSCNPNCYVDKWVVGDKLRMGIFAERYVKAGEELVFNYNVDRYGADPQPCYCGEPNCTGFIGGKTQTESGTKLSNATIEALGIDEYDDWEYAVPKKPKKARKTEEDDEEYVSNVQPKSLEEDGVTKVMAALMQCKEKWIAVKLLGRIQRAADERVMNRVVRMHGYRILKTALATFIDDANVCLQVLDILFKLPRITRNKIQDSAIEETVTKMKESEDSRVVEQATDILDIWSKLQVAYRIPRVKRDPNVVPVRIERTGRRDVRERSKSPVAPTGPKNNMPQRATPFFAGPRPPFRPRPFNPLPKGWFQANSNGRSYFYSSNGQTTWTRPTEPAIAAQPLSKQVSHEERLQQIINNITKNANTPKDSPATGTPKKEEAEESPKEEKWRSYSEEKQKIVYENTVSKSRVFYEQPINVSHLDRSIHKTCS
jgi:SET domain-containing protein